MDRSRPTAATSNQDGELNQITDLIVWAQNIGWDKGRTEDLENLARPASVGVEPAPFGHLLR